MTTLRLQNGLEKVAHYEAHLERGLYKSLHELQRMQTTPPARTSSLARSTSEFISR